nr:hypothetical protein [Leadbettera azotonutricia]
MNEIGNGTETIIFNAIYTTTFIESGSVIRVKRYGLVEIGKGAVIILFFEIRLAAPIEVHVVHGIFLSFPQ